MAPLLLLGVLLLGAGLVAHGYGSGSAALFYGGLLLLGIGAGPGTFAVGRGRWRDGVLISGISVAISIGLFLGAELAWRIREQVPTTRSAPVEPGRVYTFEEAQRNRRGYVEFWDRHLAAMSGAPWVMPDPSGVNPYVLRPGSVSSHFDSEIRINRLGFRGPEIAPDKGERFRIVAMGESTTFGVTVEAGDRPWPEVLEARIARELACDVPIEVVNAGVPGWTLTNQLARLDRDILPLRPDLLISYHGYNDFHWLFGSVPGLPFWPVPQVPARPSRLLERAEKALRFWELRRSYGPGPDPSVLDADVSHTDYAAHYHRLAGLARASRVPLALASFNMAVNAQSPEDVVAFYAESFPDVRSAIVANQLHTRLLREIATPPSVHFIDTAADLDGEYRELFVDLVHFTQPGRDRLAANLLDGIRGILIDHPRLRCVPRR
jgi:lysophospholipase L1-like esterase